ncbi:MAG: hypothetical protein VW268_08940 [Rhodospirillaceae bacterium]
MPWRDKFVALGLALSAALFAADLISPPTFALTVVPHVISVMIAALGTARAGPWAVAVPAAVFTTLGYAAKAPLLPDPSQFLINRLSISFVLIVLAWFACRLIAYRGAAEARTAADEARARVEEG